MLLDQGRPQSREVRHSEDMYSIEENRILHFAPSEAHLQLALCLHQAVWPLRIFTTPVAAPVSTPLRIEA